MGDSAERIQASQSANLDETQTEDNKKIQEIGSEDWFREVVGLQNWRIDPLKDINHVKNQDLQRVFGDKVQMKGYSYHKCKSKRLKRRVEELYKPMFQQPDLPKEGYIHESFARADVSESFYYTSINWARLAAEKWRIRDAPTEVIVYKKGGEEVTFGSVILSNLKSGIEHLQGEL